MGQDNSYWLHTIMSSTSVSNPYASYRVEILDLATNDWIETRRILNAKNRVDVLVKKKILTKQESDNLWKMIDSEDLENLVVVECILEEKEKIKTWKDKLKFWKK